MRIFIASMLLSLSLGAQDLYDTQNLFIKMKKGNELPKSQMIKSSKKHFGSLYLVETTDLFQL